MKEIGALDSSSNAYNTTKDVRRAFTGTQSLLIGTELPQPEKAHSALAPYRTQTATAPLACQRRCYLLASSLQVVSFDIFCLRTTMRV